MASPDVQTSQSRARRSPSDDIVTPQSSRVSTPRHNPSMSNSTTSSSQNITASPSSSYRPSTTQLTLDGVLAAHGGNAQAALEALLQDRNTLQSQNTQLWKLIEKSRVAYSTLGKDFERVRADRDKALARLEKYSSGGHRSHSSSAGNSSQQRTESPAPIIPNPNRPPQPHRHQSDDSILPSISSRTPPLSVSSSRSQEPLSQQPSEQPSAEQRPSQEDWSSYTMQPHTPRRPSTSPRIGGHPSSSSSEPNPRRPSYPGTSSPAVRRLPTPPAPSTPPHSQPTPLPSTPQPTIANATLPLQITPKHSTPPPPQNSTPQINSTPLSPPQTSSLSIPTHLKASRESRITLPDEASRYIANMVDTPTGSPAADKSTHNISSIPEEQQRNTQSPVVDDREPEPQAGKANGLGLSTLPNGSPPHITADDASSIDFSSDTEDATISSPPSSQTIPVINAPTDPDPPSSRRVNGRNAGYRGSMMVALSDAEAINKAVAANSPPNGIALSSSPSTTTLASSSASVSAHPTPKSQSNVSLPISTSDQSTNAAAYTYRSTRLTPPDLPHTVITVEGSHIRPNDRGKEVLSFVISVTIRDKEPYSVEKLYSDVLTLDARIKSLLSRTLVKKLGILPDNKLFKDNAPSKVDQRKLLLEQYLQSLIAAPIKNNTEVCMFLSTDLIKEKGKRAPVSQPGYKEGYLTKRGKNFGGFMDRWKTRYFVISGPVLEYYESRGGTHLGSIAITGAQIGRQQPKISSSGREEDDENAFRHAFLVIEAKKTAAGGLIRHVLCAESDEERDSWVDVLVRYVVGEYSPPLYGDEMPPSSIQDPNAPRSSTSSGSGSTADQTRSIRSRTLSKDDISKGPALSISQLPPDSHNAKLFQAPGLPADAQSGQPHLTDSQIIARKMLDHRGPSLDVPLSSSLPSNMDNPGSHDRSSHHLPSQRSNSELGHYSDMQYPHQQSSKGMKGAFNRSSFHPTSLGTIKSNSPTHDHTSPEHGHPHKVSITKISAPTNGVVIPEGYKFGAKEPSPGDQAANERERKAKSKGFWAFGRQSHAPANAPGSPPRAVFGVTIQDSLAVAQIANLPAIVFRCIQYLETKHAEQEEGIYRLSGSSAVIKALKDRFNAEGDVDLLASEEDWDPHAIAGLLKTFFRDLPTSILTKDLHLEFLTVIDLMDPKERVAELAQLISRLPLANYSLLRALTAHIILIVQNANLNKMTMRNVGIVFSPTLGIPAGVFSLMLGEFNHVFNVDQGSSDGTEPDVVEITSKAQQTLSPASAATPSKRNSISYSEAAADRMLGFSGRSLDTPEEGDSDEDGEGEDMSSQDDSGTETDNRSVDNSESERPGSPPETPGPNTYKHSRTQSAGGDIAPSANMITPPPRGHSATVAARRGLQVATDRPAPGLGLPVSPRPPGRVSTPVNNSIPNTPSISIDSPTK